MNVILLKEVDKIRQKQSYCTDTKYTVFHNYRASRLLS